MNKRIDHLAGNTNMAELAQQAHAQGCVLVGRPSGLSMEKMAITCMDRAIQLIDVGRFEEALAEARAARAILGMGEHPCSA